MAIFKFARRCSTTKRGINEGYKAIYEARWFSCQEAMLPWLRSLEGNDYEGLSDEFVLRDAEEVFYTEEEWKLHGDFWYESESEDGSDAIYTEAKGYIVQPPSQLYHLYFDNRESLMAHLKQRSKELYLGAVPDYGVYDFFRARKYFRSV